MTSLPRASVFVPGQLPVSHRKAHRLLAFIDRYHAEHGYAPSHAECAAQVEGFKSTSTVARTLTWLQGMGLVALTNGIDRSVQVVQP